MLQPTSCGPGPPLQVPPPQPQPPPAAIKATTKSTRKTSQGALKEQLQQQEHQQPEHQKKKKKQLPHQHHQQRQQQQQHRMNATNYNEIDDVDCSKKLLNNRMEKVKCWKQNGNNNKNSKNNVHCTASKNFTCKFVATSMTATVASKWTLWLLMLLACVALAPTKVTAEKSKHYYMQSLCKNHFLQQLYRKIDGAVLWSQNERNLDCIITFQTHSILQRFMLRFDMLQLDCNDHLYVYDGAHAVSTPKVDISCRNTKQTISSILTRTNFVTLKYVTDGWGTDANGFKLVITSVKDPKHTCKDFTCATREFCIHPDLLCDGINHCGDNSDESVHDLCHSQTSSTILGLDMTWFVLIVVCSLLILSACIVGWSICICRRGTTGGIGLGSVGGGGNINQNTALQMHHAAAASNGSSKHLHQYHHHHGTLTRDHTTLSPPSGNWHHPAGPSGYHRIMQHNLLKMATKVRPIWCWANFVN